MLFSISNLTKKYSKESESVLENISFSLPKKGLISIYGDSGCGKTTLINLLGLIDLPTSGTIKYNGKEYRCLNQRECDELRKNDFSFIFQDHNLINDFTVFDNVSLPLLINNDTQNIHDKVDNVLSKVGLLEYKNRKTNELSGGQIERVAIARALIKNTKVFFCDEPTASLDFNLSNSIFSLLKEISKNILVIIVSHNLDLLKKYSDKLLLIENHKLIDSDYKAKEDKGFKTSPTSSKAINKLALSPTLIKKDIISSFKKSKVLSILSFLLFLITSVLFNCSLSLYRYNPISSYIESFEKNDTYLLHVSKYMENDAKSYNSLTGESEYYGIQIASFETTEEDITILKNTVGNSCDIYSNYSYNIPLNYFSDFSSIDNVSDEYATSFMFYTAVESFNKFNQPLLRGRLPRENGEVLIYDYMVECFKHYNIIENDILNTIIEDKCSSTQFKVVGICESNYKEWIGFNSNNNSSRASYSLANLSELRTIIGFKKHFDLIKEKISNSFQFVKVDFTKRIVDNNKSDNEIVSSFNPTQINFLENNRIRDFNYIVSKFDYISDDVIESHVQGFRGIILTKKAAMKIAGIDSEEEFDGTSFNPYSKDKGTASFFNTFYTQSLWNNQSKGDLYASFEYNYSELFGIIDNMEDDNIYYCLGYIDDSFGTHNYKNGIFQHFNVALSNSKSENRNIIKTLINPDYVKKNDSYYENLTKGNEKYYFYFYNGIAALVGEARNYVRYISNVLKTFVYISGAATALFSFYFIFSIIKNNFYKYSIYKSLGLGNFRICFLSILCPIIISLGSFVISIPFSFITMSIINNSFISSFFSLSLSMLNVEIFSFMFSFLIFIFAILLGILYPIINLYKLTPAQLIRQQK